MNLNWIFKNKWDVGEEFELKDDFERKFYTMYLNYCK